LPLGGIAVLKRGVPTGLPFRDACRGRDLTFGIGERVAGEGAFVREGMALHRGREGRERALFPLAALRLPGRHNAENALAVAAAIGAIGLDLGRAAEAITAYAGLKDRLELAGCKRGVRYVNDSKATTPEAAAAGIH